MDRFYDQRILTPKPISDCYLTGYTALFISSKNSEVEPLTLQDIKHHFLQNSYTREQILQKELDIRKASTYENEVSSLFDYVMLYIKIWKMSCQLKMAEKKNWLISTYRFLCDIETEVYDISKSVLIDAESMKFKPSIIIAAVVTATIEMYLKRLFDDKCR